MGIRPNIRAMRAYTPPLEGRSSQAYLLLDFNEMTVPPSPRVKEAIVRFANSGRIQAYPEYGMLNEIVASYVGCGASEVLVTNGSDQAIDVVMRAVVDKGNLVVIPSPSFTMFFQSALAQGAEIIRPEYRGQDLDFPFEEVMELLDHNPALVVLCNPNNPTGTPISMNAVKAILEKANARDVAVLHDEAYFEFSGITALNLLKDFPNLFITRTLSKQFGLASLRAGYVVSAAENIAELAKICGPYDVNMIAKIAIEAALQDLDHSRRYIREVMGESKRRVEEFFLGNGVKFFPSAGNFLLVVPDSADTIVRRLQEEGVLVRPRENPPGTVRVSIGTLQDTERFIVAWLKVSERSAG